jgi:hypothetical protein
MDSFMTYVLDNLREHGSRAVRVFPPASRVLVSFSDRIANEVVRNVFLAHDYIYFSVQLWPPVFRWVNTLRRF